MGGNRGILSGIKAAVAVLFLVALGSGCAPSEPSGDVDGRQEFVVSGRVVAIADDRETITLNHEEMPGFMPAMTMPFYLKEASLAEGLVPGDTVEFTFVVAGDRSWIEAIRKVAPRERAAAETDDQRDAARALRARIPRLDEGDLVPSFALVNQEGEPFETGQWLGKAVAISFIFTRCPVPEFCPRMSANFRALQKEIGQSPGLRDRVQLLSVTIDPGYDTPEVLRRYAATYTDSLDNWTFATGDPARIEEMTTRFSIFVDPGDGGANIDHALGTAVVDPEGRLAKVWWGNRWEVADVLQTISSTFEERKN